MNDSHDPPLYDADGCELAVPMWGNWWSTAQIGWWLRFWWSLVNGIDRHFCQAYAGALRRALSDVLRLQPGVTEIAFEERMPG